MISTCISNPVTRLTDSNLDKILDTGYPTVLVVLNNFSNETLLKEITKNMAIVKKKFPADLWYYIADYSEKNVRIFVDLLRISSEMLPTAITFDGSAPKETNEVRKYLWNHGEINAENLELYIKDYYNNALPNYLASEPIPEQPLNEYGVYRVVSKNFPEVVLNSTGKDILLLLCTTFLPQCPPLIKMYDQLAKKLAHNENLLIAIIDPAANEI